MRVFVAGATGAIGRPLVSQLLAAGHEVTGMTRVPRHQPAATRGHPGPAGRGAGGRRPALRGPVAGVRVRARR
ncbi:MAG: NAD-dependent epimerase/dehydratase family protein [Actinobacteria bacterium]|nr:MAG: NAD-dependent epimerase/dehydratase family protein [Actinomycetota bacterium]